jgi:tetratricopeptide (TPR) repeat protein
LSFILLLLRSSMPPRQPFQHNAPNPASRALAEAKAHHQAGRLAEAERLYRTVLGLTPNNTDALRLLGALYLQDRKPEQALPLLQIALQAQPGSPEILSNLGGAFRDMERGEEAATHFRQALAINPNFVDALLNLGDVLRAQGNDEAALDCYEKAASKKPGDVYVLRNLGVALWRMGRRDDAHAKVKRALQKEPNNPEVITTLGEFLQEEGKIGEALKYYNRALARAPEFTRALWQKSTALLAMGEYREGWKVYETRIGRMQRNLFAPVKPWDGSPAPGKHLVIWTEQGLGDSLQFIRYAELCKQRVGKVSIFCVGHKPLVRLFKSMPFIDDAFDGAAPDGSHFDEHVPMMSLPHLFDTVLETVPASVPYLRVDCAIQEKWKAKFAGVATLKIGLVWAGGSRENFVNAALIDRRRSVGLEPMKPWLDLQGARFYSLQKGKQANEIAALGLQDRITDFMDEVDDFADTAAIIENLDLVITVDTSVAHLAGGLGKPVWILSRYDACWRWLQNRPTNPWYPTARIFGQPSMGDWDSVIAEVGRELALEIAKRAH